MASICHRCALQIQRAAQTESRNLIPRYFSTTSTQQHVLPTFADSSNPELNDLLASFREKHLIPARLRGRERRLVFGTKYRQQLADNPQTVTIAGEDVELKWIDRTREIPNRKKLVSRAINMILSGERKDLENLPKLLEGLNDGLKKPLNDMRMEKVIRKAMQDRKVGVVIQCLQKAESTGMTLRNDAVLRSVLVGMHGMAQRGGWTIDKTGKALSSVKVIASLLETEAHGGGRTLTENDPRTRPEVLGLFLELAAVYAYKFTDAKDPEGLVKSYVARLLDCLKARGAQRPNITLEKGMRQWSMLTTIPVWHGLRVAKKVLGRSMPQVPLANETIAKYEAALTPLVEELEARNPQPGTYDEEALIAWRECVKL